MGELTFNCRVATGWQCVVNKVKCKAFWDNEGAPNAHFVQRVKSSAHLKGPSTSSELGRHFPRHLEVFGLRKRT